MSNEQKKIVVNGQEVAPARKAKLPKGTRIADVVPAYQSPAPHKEQA